MRLLELVEVIVDGAEHRVDDGVVEIRACVQRRAGREDAHIARARPEDLQPTLALLDGASLPRDGVAEHFETFLVARAGGQIVGTIGLERYGESALLRSLAVAPNGDVFAAIPRFCRDSTSGITA